MVKAPREITDPVLEERLVFGAVFRLDDVEFPGGTKKPKYMVIVKSVPAEGTVYYFFTTKNVARYDRNPRVKRDVVIILANRLPYFPLDTVLQCDVLLSLPVETLKEKYSDGKFQLKGLLPADIMSDITNAVKNSKQLSKADIAIILGND